MRRKDKFIVNGALWGAGLTALGDILIQWHEHEKRGEKFTWDNYNRMRTLENSLKGGLLGAGAGYLYYEYKISEESKIPFNSDGYLKTLLTSESLKENPTLLQKAKTFKDSIKKTLLDRYGNKLAAEPEDTGSFIKGTANNSSFDLDIVLPFKFSSFSSLEEMYNHTFDTIHNEYSNYATIQKQTKAISIVFENETDFLNFDIVPGREINNYRIDKDLNLYVRPDWAWQRGSSFKTNISIQKDITSSKPAVKRTIRLLKLYVKRNNLYLPKLIIEQGVAEALSERNYGLHVSSTENLLNSMNYIAEILKKKAIIDYANSNNNLNNKISSSQRSYVSDQLFRDVSKIEESPRYIKEIFWV